MIVDEGIGQWEVALQDEGDHDCWKGGRGRRRGGRGNLKEDERRTSWNTIEEKKRSKNINFSMLN